MSLSDQDKHRRLAAKRNNERVKLFASTLNALALTTFGAAFILPSVNGGIASPPGRLDSGRRRATFMRAWRLPFHAERGLIMTSMWVIYGLPALSLVFAATGILYLRHSAHSFDRKYGGSHHAGPAE